jgi:CubicO group peptidase (beta-lactamase class C family)
MMERRRSILFCLAMTLMATRSSGAEPALSDTEQAVYLQRLAGAGPNGRDTYDPLEAVPGAADPVVVPAAPHPTISAEARAKAVAYAMANNSKALIIWRDGRLETEAYGLGASATTPINARSMAKPLGAIAIGRAIKLGAIKDLDQPAAAFIASWRGTAKAAITIRQLLNMTSGLAEQGAVGDPASVMSRAYLSPRHDAVLVDDYPLTAVPGERYQYSNASADLIAVVIERATGRRYAEFLSSELLKPMGAAGGEVWVDRPGGLAHSGCCILLPARTWLSLGLLLMQDGTWSGRRLLPPGYVKAMLTPTVSNPRYGLGVWLQGDYVQRRGFGRPDQMLGAVLHSEPYLAKDLFLFDGNANQVLYMVPSQHLAILRMGDPPPKSPEWDNAYLPNLILRDLER